MESRIFAPLHWYWTTPVGFIIAFVLMRGRRVWTPRTNLIGDVIAILGAVATLVLVYLAPMIVQPPSGLIG